MARGGAQDIPRPADARPGAPNPWTGRLRPEHLTLDRIEIALAEHAAGMRPKGDGIETPMRPPFMSSRRQSAVLAPLFEHEGETHVLLTRRSSRLRIHRGEVAFPGGRVDDGESLEDAALREAHEEIALPPHHVRIIGRLEPLSTLSSQAMITPFVGVIDELPPLAPNPVEVERIFHVPLWELATEECYREEIWSFPDGEFPVWFFEVEGDTIWGATSRMLRRLLDVLVD